MWKSMVWRQKINTLQYIDICTKLFNIHLLDLKTKVNLEEYFFANIVCILKMDYLVYNFILFTLNILEPNWILW